METMRGQLHEVGCLWTTAKVGIGIRRAAGERVIRLRCTKELAQQAGRMLYGAVEVDHADGVAVAVRPMCGVPK